MTYSTPSLLIGFRGAKLYHDVIDAKCSRVVVLIEPSKLNEIGTMTPVSEKRSRFEYPRVRVAVLVHEETQSDRFYVFNFTVYNCPCIPVLPDYQLRKISESTDYLHFSQQKIYRGVDQWFHLHTNEVENIR